MTGSGWARGRTTEGGRPYDRLAEHLIVWYEMAGGSVW